MVVGSLYLVFVIVGFLNIIVVMGFERIFTGDYNLEIVMVVVVTPPIGDSNWIIDYLTKVDLIYYFRVYYSNYENLNWLLGRKNCKTKVLRHTLSMWIGFTLGNVKYLTLFIS